MMSESINGIAAINRIRVIINPIDTKYQINREYMIIIEFILNKSAYSNNIAFPHKNNNDSITIIILFILNI